MMAALSDSRNFSFEGASSFEIFAASGLAKADGVGREKYIYI